MGKNAKTTQKLVKKQAKVKQERMSQVYRQFSREKYNRYKRQFPRMRQSEIVGKIIKQWELLDEEAKDDFQKKFVARSGKDFFKSGSSSLSKNKSKSKSKSKSSSKSKSVEKKAFLSKASQAIKKAPVEKKKKKISPQTRIFVEKKKSPKRETSDFKKSSSKEEKHFDSSENPSQIIAKMKKIKKKKDKKKSQNSKNSAYVQFYKYYYERLSSQHPRWNTTQITTIIKLLWKKRAKQNRKGLQNKEPKLKKIGKPISGWMFYRKIKEAEGLSREKIKNMWRTLPIQSKRFYKIQGQGKKIKRKSTSGAFVRRVLNAGVIRTEQTKTDGIIQKDYSWMEKQMN